MSCASCEAYRKAIKSAVKAGDVPQVVTATMRAALALGENAGRRILKGVPDKK